MSYGYKIPQYEGAKRTCCKCGLEDSPIYAGEADPETGKPIFDHKIVIDLVFIDRDRLTDKERRDGYVYNKLADRHAKVRLMCRPCLELAEQTRQVWRDYEEQKERDQQEEGAPSFYSILCME